MFLYIRKEQTLHVFAHKTENRVHLYYILNIIEQ